METTPKAPKPIQYLARFTAATLILVMPVIIAVITLNLLGL